MECAAYTVDNEKRMKYIEFCLAFYALSLQKELFDFKEIGATLHDKIGGSKVFDQQREVFSAARAKWN